MARVIGLHVVRVVGKVQNTRQIFIATANHHLLPLPSDTCFPDHRCAFGVHILLYSAFTCALSPSLPPLTSLSLTLSLGHLFTCPPSLLCCQGKIRPTEPHAGLSLAAPQDRPRPHHLPPLLFPLARSPTRLSAPTSVSSSLTLSLSLSPHSAHHLHCSSLSLSSFCFLS